jgi:DHA1 family tetracycline resistance protein-like MFS transporter
VIPFIVEKYVALKDVPIYVGLIMSSYALCQFLAAPVLGMLSDRFGRRPILLISLAGSVIGYILFGIGGSLGMLFLGRVIDGLTGGNISTIFAYIADVTEPKKRGKYYGLAGAVGGIGFMVGPAVGGLLGGISLTAPMYLAAAVMFVNMLWGYFVLPESLAPEHRLAKFEIGHLNPFGQFKNIFSIKVMRMLLFVSFLFFAAGTAMQSTTSIFIKDVMGWGPAGVGIILFIVGLIDILAQGFLTSKLLHVMGEIKLTILGLIINGTGFLMLGAVSIFASPILLYVSTVIFVLGDGLFQPAMSGLIANSVEPKMQGRIQGANQGVQSIARIIGPLYATFLYQFAPGLPYLTGAIIIALGLFTLGFSLQTIVKHKTAS